MASSTKRSWKLQDFVAHSSNVNCLALGHKSGRVLVTGGDDKKVNLWAVGKPNCIMSLSGHTTSIECVRFGQTEDLVCAGSQTGALKIWDLEHAKLARTLTGHKAGIKCMDFHPYGELLASGSLDTAIKLWDIRRKGCIFTYKGHNLAVNSLKFSPDGQWIASAGEEGMVKLWDLRAGRQLREFSEHRGPALTVEFHPHEFLLASGSADRTVHFWDLESFQLVSSTEQNHSSGIRCLYFSQGGECLFAGSHDVLKVYGWEPGRTLDTVPTGWGKVLDIAVAQNQLIGASCHTTNIILYVCDLKKIAPLGGVSLSPFNHGNSLRKSFSRERPPELKKHTLDVRTIEEADKSGTDPEDEATYADIPNVSEYRDIFQPNRALSRTPPPEPEAFQEPQDVDPSQPQPLGPQRSNSTLTPRVAPMAAVIPVMDDGKLKNRVPSPDSPKHYLKRQNSCRESEQGYESDYPVQINNIRHSPSDPALNRPNTAQSRSTSLNRNFANSASLSARNTATTGTSTSKKNNKLQVLPTPKVDTVTQLRSPIDDIEKEEFVPMSADKPFGLDVETFLPKSSYAGPTGLVYSQMGVLAEMSEAEVLNSMMRGHEPMMAVLTSRHRSLQIVYSLWHNKDLKSAIDSAVAMNDLAIIVDLLGILTLKPTIWNLDLCNLLLGPIAELVQSKYEIYITVGLSALRLILRNFASVIKSNVEAPLHTIGVDVSREERYQKCLSCYEKLSTIRGILLKKQSAPGKLGASFRELSVLIRSLE
ncbi:katanin p80 WD40 repeat-containing subunit B1 isoform X3 [Vespula pensylvanica]|uniref:katanin p80 WD40 repeat-containing subunit B1 isoform X3 n=1 Tax=Vespula pensylvanica TaxID=30213 RepID=UPI001CBA426A|nr:katanin p80 WD40 repeat-containing subunit B1 isoform X3 [Vespula pensylvanica]